MIDAPGRGSYMESHEMDIDGIDINEFYPYSDASRHIPGRRTGKKISKRTVERWRCHGVLRDGVRVRLRATLIGGGWHTCDTWVREFIAALNRGGAASNDPVTARVVGPRTPSQRERASATARRRLDQLWKRKAA